MTKQEYLMIVAMEECAEVAQALSKCIRFGVSVKTLMEVKLEFNDLFAMIDWLEDTLPDDSDLSIDINLIDIKQRKVAKYMPEDLK